MVDVHEIVKRIIKYLVEGLAVGLVSFLMLRKTPDIEEIFLLSLTASSVFAILDVFVPVAGQASRTGFGVGTGLALSPFAFPRPI
jgi:hypothetical protein